MLVLVPDQRLDHVRRQTRLRQADLPPLYDMSSGAGDHSVSDVLASTASAVQASERSLEKRDSATHSLVRPR